VHRRPFDQPAPRKLLDMSKALLRSLAAGLALEAVGRDGRIDDCIHFGADALDDARVHVRIVGLPSAALIVGMQVHDRGPGLYAGDTLLDDILHRYLNAGLALPGPRSVERHFQPG